jgi:DNA-binding cell septation regulator SpoVG
MDKVQYYPTKQDLTPPVHSLKRVRGDDGQFKDVEIPLSKAQRKAHRIAVNKEYQAKRVEFQKECRLMESE